LVGVAIQWISGPAESFLIYVIGALVAGFSMCLLNIVVNPMLNTLGGGGNTGNRLMQFGGSCNSIGGTIAPILLGYLVGGQVENASVSDAAPAMIIAMVIFALAAVIIAFTKIPEPHMETPEERAARKAGKVVKDEHSALSFRHFVLGAVAIFLYMGLEVGIPNTANVYFSEIDWVGPVLTGTMIGGYWLCMMIGRLCGGLLGGKVSSRAMLASVASLGAVLCLCVMIVPESVTLNLFDKVIPLALIFVMLCGLCTSIMWGAIFNLSTEGLGRYTTMASGIFMTLVCGGGIIPFVQNVLADHIGSLQSYGLLIVCMLYLVYYALVGSKNVNTDIKTE
jgi:MFS transporter, FHS family, L-fucose permease